MSAGYQVLVANVPTLVCAAIGALSAIKGQQSTVDEGVRPLQIGDPVRCVYENLDEQWRDDWKDWSGFIARIGYCPGNDLNYTVSDEWPPRMLTDGFAPNQLALSAIRNGDEGMGS